MSDEYLDVISWRETKSGKPFAMRVGSAKKLDNGNINVYFDALPMPNAKGCQVTIAPRRDKPVAGTNSDMNSDPLPF